MKKIFTLATGLFFAFQLHAQSPNWAEDIAPILYNHCTQCHNPNGVAPFSLITAQDAISNDLLISASVDNRIMPPWPPDKNYRHFAYERVLTQAEIDTIVAWVNNGSAAGDTTLAPPAPVYSGAAEIVNPTLVTQMQNYTVNTATDLYRCFVMPTGIATQKFITEIEAIPGNRNIVHHVLIYADTSGVPASLDAADPGPGYTSFGGTGSSASKLIGTWVPGQTAYRLPANMGFKLPANSNIIIQVHYPGGTFGQTDSTQVRFKLVNGPMREVGIVPFLNHDQLDNGPLHIPADSVKTFYAHFQVPGLNFSVLSIGPHMHLIGKTIRSYGVTPLNDTIPLISIPDWDFHWQGLYSYQYVQKIPANTVLYSEAVYDNTTLNPENPNNPPQDINLGESTTDEMMLVFFAFTYYFPGDENILIDSSLVTATDDYSFAGVISSLQLYDPYPNPAGEELSFQFFSPGKIPVELNITDITGKTVFRQIITTYAGLNTQKIQLADWAVGNYILTLKQGDVMRSKQFLRKN